jgi:hypothetical protein
MKSALFYTALFFLFNLGICSMVSGAAISPDEIVFSGERKSVQLTLINPKNKSIGFSITAPYDCSIGISETSGTLAPFLQKKIFLSLESGKCSGIALFEFDDRVAFREKINVKITTIGALVKNKENAIVGIAAALTTFAAVLSIYFLIRKICLILLRRLPS